MGSVQKAIVLLTVCTFLTSLYVVHSATYFNLTFTSPEVQMAVIQQKCQQLLNNLMQLNQQLDNPTPPITKRLPTTCDEAVKQSKYHKSGIYKLLVPGSDVKTWSAHCLVDPNKNGSAWTIIQRCQDNSTDYRYNWTDYKHGFGNKSHEYFIGLEPLYTITKNQKHELWIELKNYEGESRHAKYNRFSIGSERMGYEINVLGDYDGNADEKLRYQKYKKFINDPDVDNDYNVKKYAKYSIDAFWFNKCHKTHHLAETFYEQMTGEITQREVQWLDWQPGDQKLKYVHMAVRPLKSN